VSRHPPEERYHRPDRIDDWLAPLLVRIRAGEGSATEEGLAFLEEDPYRFRSGYARERVARALARAPLDDARRARARALVLSVVDGERCTPHPGISRLAGAVADNQLRRQLRARLHSADGAVAFRALRAIAAVRHPGLTAADLRSVRATLLRSAGRRSSWPSPEVMRLAARFWDDGWAVDLRGLAGRHGPDRAAARAFLAEADRRQARRSGRDARPGP
jgi:hypothetical protein